MKRNITEENNTVLRVRPKGTFLNEANKRRVCVAHVALFSVGRHPAIRIPLSLVALCTFDIKVLFCLTLHNTTTALH